MSKRSKAKYEAALAVCAGGLSLVVGQDALAQQPSPGGVEEVTVTGTRLVTSGVNTPTPVTAVTGAELQTMAPTTLIDSLSQLPVFDNNLSTQQNAGGSVASGGSNLNLRGAGAPRTLVLLDGHRLGPSNEYGTVDVSVVPEILVRSVEAVTGGASAAYGADAVAGVVNFRLDRTFTGLKYSLQAGTSTYRDDNNYKVGLAYGTDLGSRGHLIMSAEGYRKDGIRSFDSQQDRRDFYPLRARVTNPAYAGDPTHQPQWLAEQYVQPTNYTPGGVLLGPAQDAAGTAVAMPAALDHLEFLPNGSGQTRPLPFSGIGALSGGCNCQAQPTLDYGVNADQEFDTPADRGSFFAHYDHDINDRNSFYVETLLATNNASTRWQTAALLGPWGTRVYADNPFLPLDVRQTMQAAGVDSVAFGIFTPNTNGNPFAGSELVTRNRYGQYTAGFTHDMSDDFLAGSWTLSGYVQYAQNKQETYVPRGMRTDRLFEALDVVTDPATGKPACRISLPQYDPTGIFSDCVPINLFGGTAAVTPAAADFVTDDGKIARGRTTEDDVELTFGGDLTRGSGILGPISAAFGVSWRQENLSVGTVDPCDEFPCTPDGVRLSDLGLMSPTLRGIEPEVGCPVGSPNGIPGLRYVPTGFCGDSSSSTVLFTSQRAVEGGYNVREGFFEFGIPLLKDGRLNLNEAYRVASYTGSGNKVAWKSGVSFQATPKLRLRATRSQDVRAPTLRERFEQQRGGVNVSDPAIGGATYGTSSFSGGNPNVGLETALTNTVGIVYQPLNKFSMTIDWYDIDLDDAIGPVGGGGPSGPQNLVTGCWNSPGHNSSSLCQYVVRSGDPITGVIDRVETIFINLSNERINGFDTEFNLTGINVGRGTLNWRLLGSRLNENSILVPGSPRDQRAGDIASGLPQTKVTTSLTYANGPASVFLQERYIGGGTMDRNLHEGVGPNSIDDNTVDSVMYTDLAFTYSGGDKSGSTPWQVFLTVNNLLNEEPPAAAPALGRTGVPGPSSVLYDTIGRRFTAGVRVNF